MTPDIDLLADPSTSATGTDGDVLAVRAVAAALDRVRETIVEIGLATLLAQVRGMSPEVVCAVLDELADASAAALSTLTRG